MPTVPLPPFSSDDSGVDAPPHIHDLANEIIHLNLIELAALMDRIGEHFGFDDSDAFGGDGGGESGDGAGADEEVKEEKTAFDLKLEGFDAKAKIKVIKEIRALTGLGLKEAKELVEGAPVSIGC
jgi:large subunit ribosomal protein L7/L12